MSVAQYNITYMTKIMPIKDIEKMRTYRTRDRMHFCYQQIFNVKMFNNSFSNLANKVIAEE